MPVLTAEATSATARAEPKPSTCSSSGKMSAASNSIAASSPRTGRKPMPAVKGSRSAAMSGGRTALSTATTAATATAPAKPRISAPGSSWVASSRASADASHAAARRSGRSRGRAGLQSGTDARCEGTQLPMLSPELGRKRHPRPSGLAYAWVVPSRHCPAARAGPPTGPPASPRWGAHHRSARVRLAQVDERRLHSATDVRRVREAELEEDRVDVLLDRPLGEHELVGDRLVVLAAGDAGQDL